MNLFLWKVSLSAIWVKKINFVLWAQHVYMPPYVVLFKCLQSLHGFEFFRWLLQNGFLVCFVRKSSKTSQFVHFKPLEHRIKALLNL